MTNLERLLEGTPEWELLDFDPRTRDPRNTADGFRVRDGDREEIMEGRVWQITKH
jgi:hypothetical protein